MGTSAPGPPPNCGRFACGTKSGHHRGCGTGGNVGPGAWAHAESLEEAERERLERVVSGIDRLIDSLSHTRVFRVPDARESRTVA